MRIFFISLISLFTIIYCAAPLYSFESEETSMQKRKRKKRVRYLKHTVNVNEDIYSILNRYLITFSDIKDGNPDIDLTNLEPGQTIKLNKKLIGKSNSAEIELDLGNYITKEPEIDSIAEEVSLPLYIFHHVEAGQTMYSLGRKYGTTVEKLQLINQDSILNGVLRKGSTIKIPNNQTVDTDEVTAEKEVEQIEKMFKEFSISTPANVSLLMPFSNNSGGRNTQFIEFYQGFLLGIDSIKREQISVNLNIYDTKRSNNETHTIMKSPDFISSDLIIGPIYRDQFNEVSSWASVNGVPIVSPFTKVENQDRGSFQISPNNDSKYDKIKEYLQNKNVIYIKSIDDDSVFIKDIKSLLPVTENITTISFNPKQKPETIAKLLSSSKSNLFIIATNKGNIADEIISKISAVKTFSYNSQIEILGTPIFARTQQINPSHLFKLNLSYITLYHVNRTNEDVINFDNKYIAKFGNVPSLYAYRGYDMALMFLGAMIEYGSDFPKYIEQYKFKNLSVRYNFIKSVNDSYINDSWTLVTYTPNYKILVR